jgi:hypothetical protein
MKVTRRGIEICIEQTRSVRTFDDRLAWCEPCCMAVRGVSPRTASAITGLPLSAVYRLLENGEIHVAGPHGHHAGPLCFESLKKLR